MPGKGPGDDLIYEMQSSLSVCGTTLSGHKHSTHQNRHLEQSKTFKQWFKYHCALQGDLTYAKNKCVARPSSKKGNSTVFCQVHPKLQIQVQGISIEALFFYTPIKSCQKWSLRLILVEKSSLVHDIWWIYAPFNVVSLL